MKKIRSKLEVNPEVLAEMWLPDFIFTLLCDTFVKIGFV